MLTCLILWLVLYPLGWLMWGAFHSGPPGAESELTLSNFRAVYLDPNHWLLVWRSVLVGAGGTIFATLIGAPLAWLIVKTDLTGKSWVELSAIVPFFTSTFIGALACIFLGNPTNGTLKLWFGIPINIYSAGGIIWVTGLYVALHVLVHRGGAAKHGYRLQGGFLHLARRAVADPDAHYFSPDTSGAAPQTLSYQNRLADVRGERLAYFGGTAAG